MLIWIALLKQFILCILYAKYLFTKFCCALTDNSISFVMTLSKSPNRTWCLQNLSTSLHRLQRIHHQPISCQTAALPVDLHYSKQAQVNMTWHDSCRLLGVMLPPVFYVVCAFASLLYAYIELRCQHAPLTYLRCILVSTQLITKKLVMDVKHTLFSDSTQFM